MIRGLFTATVLGAIVFALGLALWGETDGRNFSWSAVLPEPDGQGLAALQDQPQKIYSLTFVALFIGFVSGVVRSRQSRITVDKESTVSATSNNPRAPSSSSIRIPLSQLESHPFLPLLGFLTLGVCRFFAVPQGFILVFTAFGKFRKAAKPGLSWILSFWGFYHHPWGLISVKEQIKSYPEETVFTSDGVKCRIDVTICYKIVEPIKAAFDVTDLMSSIENVVRAVLRNECGKLPARALLASREKMASSLRETLDTDAEPWGVEVRLVEITEVDISVQERSPRA